MSDQLRVGEHVETGEILCPECGPRLAAMQELRSELAAANEAIRRAEIQQAGDASTIRSLNFKLEEAKRDREEEAREHEFWDEFFDHFDLWRVAAGAAERKKKKQNRPSGGRFFLWLPLRKAHGADRCQMAIIGRTFQHYIDRRSNGSEIHYFEWERIFGAKGEGNTPDSNFEESCLRAPSDWRKRVEAYGFSVAKSKEEEGTK